VALTVGYKLTGGETRPGELKYCPTAERVPYRRDTLSVYLPSERWGRKDRIQHPPHILRALPELLCIVRFLIVGGGPGMVGCRHDIPLRCHPLCQPIKVTPVAAVAVGEQYQRMLTGCGFGITQRLSTHKDNIVSYRRRCAVL